MPQYLLIATTNILENNEIPYYYDLAVDLTREGNRATLLFVQNGVFAAKEYLYGSDLEYLRKTKLEIVADKLSLAERGLTPGKLLPFVRPVSLRGLRLSRQTFVLVNPSNHAGGITSRRLVNLALRRGLDVSFFAYEEALNCVFSRGLRRPLALREKAHPGDWVASLFEKIERQGVTLTWVDCGFQAMERHDTTIKQAQHNKHREAL